MVVGSGPPQYLLFSTRTDWLAICSWVPRSPIVSNSGAARVLSIFELSLTAIDRVALLIKVRCKILHHIYMLNRYSHSRHIHVVCGAAAGNYNYKNTNNVFRLVGGWRCI